MINKVYGVSYLPPCTNAGKRQFDKIGFKEIGKEGMIKSLNMKLRQVNSFEGPNALPYTKLPKENKNSFEHILRRKDIRIGSAIWYMNLREPFKAK